MTALGGAIPRVRARVRADRAAAALIVGAGVAMLALYLLVKGSLVDDAYITLAYARNLGLHLHWGMLAGETANTATSPLNVLLLGAGTALTRSPMVALGLVSVGAAMTTAWALVRTTRALALPPYVAALALALILVNPFLLSAIGLEVLLVAAALTTLAAMALERRPGWFGVAAGLTLLVRVDLFVFVVAVAVAVPELRAGWRRVLAGAAASAGPWFLFSWIALGSALPDTAVIKTSQVGLFRPFGYVTGPVLYFQRHWNTVSLAFLPALLGLLLLAAWLTVRFAVRWRASEGPPAIGVPAALAVGGVAYYALLSALRVPPYHWYYVPPLVALSTFLAIAAGAWLQRAHADARLRAGLPLGALAAAALLALGCLARDVKQGVPWRAPLVMTNFAVARDYERVAHALHARIGSATVAPAGEIGTLAYYCDCRIVDVFSDRGQAVQLINQRIRADGPIRSLPYRLNYLLLDRSQKPLPAVYELHYARGAASGPDTWRVWSPWLGTGHIWLTRR